MAGSRANDSFLQTADASGVALATHLQASKEYPTWIQADANGYVEHDVYVAGIAAMAVAANKHYLSIVNTEATKIVEVVRMKIIVELTAAVTGLARGYRLFRCTGHSAGTLITPEELDTTSPAVPAGVTVRGNGPTITGLGTTPMGLDSLNEEETGAAGVGGDEGIFSFMRTQQAIVLRQNQGVTIQQDATAGVGLRSALVFFRVRDP